MNSLQIISAFRSISNFTGDMAEAAGAGEWEKLTELEGRCAAVVAQLRAGPAVRASYGRDAAAEDRADTQDYC